MTFQKRPWYRDEYGFLTGKGMLTFVILPAALFVISLFVFGIRATIAYHERAEAECTASGGRLLSIRDNGYVCFSKDAFK